MYRISQSPLGRHVQRARKKFANHALIPRSLSLGLNILVLEYQLILFVSQLPESVSSKTTWVYLAVFSFAILPTQSSQRLCRVIKWFNARVSAPVRCAYLWHCSSGNLCFSERMHVLARLVNNIFVIMLLGIFCFLRLSELTTAGEFSPATHLLIKDMSCVHRLLLFFGPDQSI